MRSKGSYTHSNNRCNKFDQELGHLQQRRVEMIKEIDEKAFDMRTIVILEKISEPTRKIEQMVADLIRHDHDTPIP